jgi:hypothetical protein
MVRGRIRAAVDGQPDDQGIAFRDGVVAPSVEDEVTAALTANREPGNLISFGYYV